MPDDNASYKLILGESNNQNDQTVHILWPSVEEYEEDGENVAWCLESVDGSLKNPDTVTPLDDEQTFCQTCSQKATNIDDPPEFIDESAKE